MSDYKDFVGTIFSRAKDLAESEAVNGMVERVKEAAQSTGIVDVFEKGSQRARSFGSATRLTVDLNRDYKELERVFSEIGKLYYEQTSSSPEGFFAPLFEQAEAVMATIRAKEEELQAYKAGFTDAAASPQDEIDDFEAVVNRTEDDGTAR